MEYQKKRDSLHINWFIRKKTEEVVNEGEDETEVRIGQYQLLSAVI